MIRTSVMFWDGCPKSLAATKALRRLSDQTTLPSSPRLRSESISMLPVAAAFAMFKTEAQVMVEYMMRFVGGMHSMAHTLFIQFSRKGE